MVYGKNEPQVCRAKRDRETKCKRYESDGYKQSGYKKISFRMKFDKRY